MSKLIIHYYPHLHGYVATCADYPNVKAFGVTPEEARHAAEVDEVDSILDEMEAKL